MEQRGAAGRSPTRIIIENPGESGFIEGAKIANYKTGSVKKKSNVTVCSQLLMFFKIVAVIRLMYIEVTIHTFCMLKHCQIKSDHHLYPVRNNRRLI